MMSFAPMRWQERLWQTDTTWRPFGCWKYMRVEGHDLVDVRGREVEQPGHVLLDLERDVAERLLGHVEHGQERACAARDRAPGAVAPRRAARARTAARVASGISGPAPADHVDGAEGRDDVGDHLALDHPRQRRHRRRGTAGGSARGTGDQSRPDTT